MLALLLQETIRGTSQQKLYKELELESLKFRRWYRRLCFLYKLYSSGLPKYLLDLIPKESHSYNTRQCESFGTYYCRTDTFKYSFFPYTITEWNKLDAELRRSGSYLIFKNSLLKLGRPIPSSNYNIHNPLGLKLLTRLRLGLSHLNEHRFKHNFQNCLNPLCSCSLEVESTAHFFLHCHYYSAIRTSLLNDLSIIDPKITNLSDDLLLHLLLYGDKNMT